MGFFFFYHKLTFDIIEKIQIFQHLKFGHLKFLYDKMYTVYSKIFAPVLFSHLLSLFSAGKFKTGLIPMS